MELNEAPVKQMVKRGFKKTEVGTIPDDWTLKPIASLADVRGRVGWKGYTKADLRNDGPLTIGAKHIDKDNKLDLSDPTFLSIEKFLESPEIAVRKGDVLIVQRGTIGSLVLIDREIGDATINPSMLILRSQRVDTAYLYYQLISTTGQKQILLDTSSTGVPMITQKQVGGFLIPLPTTDQEQRAIATALSDVDALLGSLDALIAKKKAIKQGAMQQLLTGKQRLPGFKGEWSTASIDGVVRRVTGFWGMGIESSDSPKMARIIRAGDVSSDGKLVATAERFLSQTAFATAECQKDDIVITVSGNGLGKVWLADGRPDVCVSNFVRALKPKRGLSGAYLYYQLCSPQAQRLLVEYTATSAYPNLRPSFFAVNWLPTPSMEEQTAIATVLSDMDAEIGALEARRAKTALLKQGMMQELLTGRVRLV